jgi:S1-C subfamily serine protease
MNKFYKSFVVALSASLVFSSCASILNGKYQKVTVETGDSNSKVYVNGDLQGQGSSVVTKMKRDGNVKQIKVTRDGYKPTYAIHYQTAKSPLYILSWVPFGVLFYPPFLDVAPKSFNYSKHIAVQNDNVKIQKRQPNEKYLYLKNTAFDVKKEDLKFTVIKRRNQKKNKEKYREQSSFNEDIKFDNSIFSDAVSEILKDNDYADTTHTVFASNTNSLNLSSKITKVQVDNAYAYAARRVMNLLVAKVEIEWEVLDLYGQSKFKKSFNAKSGEFSVDYTNRGDAIRESVGDAILSSFYQFVDTPEVQDLIKQQESKELKLETLRLTRPAVISSLEDAMEATVTIKNKDGFGSGCFVSNDGYIVTNFHVVSPGGTLTVVDKQGKEFPATLIRKNEFSDLALLKIDTQNAKAFTMPKTKNYKIGDDIFAIGTPKSLELGQSLSKGIISGLRSQNNISLIQTDASVNGGNSGGALVSKSGEFIGVVNAKLFGVGVEGLGFSIPAETVMQDLSIDYKG